jgi:hypothetical protein
VTEIIKTEGNVDKVREKHERAEEMKRWEKK